jgi:SAM-dependent methyltransferase
MNQEMIAMNTEKKELELLLQCPRCTSRLTRDGGKLSCSYVGCDFFRSGFLEFDGQPVLIDFENSILSSETFVAQRGASPVPRRADFLRSTLRRIMWSNEIPRRYCAKFLSLLKEQNSRPRILVLGGGTIGMGAEALYSDTSIDLLGCDIYASPHTRVVADGHCLPFVSESFDGVWIQSVLEHVLSPQLVVDEIHRVLRPDGVVYSDTPFMQPVHERAYDFTRFSLSGHRWLFRNFGLLDAGVSAGAGIAFTSSARYLIRSLTGSDKISTALAFPLFWVRFLERITKRRPNSDAASAVFFFGRKSDKPITPKDVVAFYEDFQKQHRAN